jgi:phosphopantothenoylcysteine synthetase/decarboxylase
VSPLSVTYLIVTGAVTVRRLPDLIADLVPVVPPLLTVLTENATRVVSPRELALVPGHQVVESYFDQAILPRPPDGLVVVAPCSFNSLNKLACGIADTLALSIAAEAIGRATPVVVAVSVNDPLWRHPLAARSVATLRSWGVTVVEPVPDENGRMTMAANADILAAVTAALRAWRGSADH